MSINWTKTIYLYNRPENETNFQETETENMKCHLILLSPIPTPIIKLNRIFCQCHNYLPTTERQEIVENQNFYEF